MPVLMVKVFTCWMGLRTWSCVFIQSDDGETYSGQVALYSLLIPTVKEMCGWVA